jgi:hypothetical protein
MTQKTAVLWIQIRSYRHDLEEIGSVLISTDV